MAKLSTASQIAEILDFDGRSIADALRTIEGGYIRVVDDYGVRGQISQSQRVPGRTVLVLSDQRIFWIDPNPDAPKDDDGWSVPFWVRPITQGTLQQRNNRIGGYAGWPIKGMRFLETHVEIDGIVTPKSPNVQWEYRLAGEPSGVFADSPALTQDDWVVIPQAADLMTISLSSVRAEALSSTADAMVTLSAAVHGVAPDRFEAEWSGYKTGFKSLPFTTPDYTKPEGVLGIGDSMLEAKWLEGAVAGLGVPLKNVAKFSSGAKQAFRLGTRLLYFSAQGGMIPASGVPVSVTSINGVAPSPATSFDMFAPEGFLNTNADDTVATHCSESGTWGGRHGVVSVPNGGTPTYTFVPDDGLAATPVDPQAIFVPDNLDLLGRYELVIRLSQNYAFVGPGNPAFPHDINPRVIEDIQLILDRRQGQRTTVLCLTADNAMTAGTPYYTALRYINAQFEALWPNITARVTVGGQTYNNFEYIREFGRDGSQNDQDDYAAGIMPRSCMADGLHHNAKGQGLERQFWELWRQQQRVPPALPVGAPFQLKVFGTLPVTGEVVSDMATASVQAGGSAFDAEAREMAEGSVKLGDAVSLMAETPDAKIMTAIERDKVSTIARIQMTDGTQAFGLGWVIGDVFHVHTMFRPDLSIENVYLDAIRRKADLAPSTFLSGSEQHRFVVAVQDPTDAQKAYVLFGVRSDGSLDSPEYNQVLAEVFGARTALKQQLHGRKAAYGFGLFGLRKALLAARGSGSVDLVMPGDSLTTNIIHLTVRRLFGRLLGFGGPGMLPWHATGLGYDGTSGAITMNAGNWTFWTYNPTTSPNPPAGTNGWGLCWLKSGGTAVAGNGQSSMVFQAPYRDRPEYKFDTVRVFFFSTGGDASFRVRANTADGSSPGPWTTATASTAVAYVDLPGFGSASGRYRIDIEEQISGAGRLYIGAVCPFNSAGGIRFNRQSLGGYKAGDIAGQDGTAQAFYYANLPSGKPAAGSIHLAHNDSGTDDATYLANMRTIATRLRTANPDCSLTFTQWFSAAALKREAAIKSLAAQYDGTVFDVRDIIPSREWAAAKNLLQQPATPDDPHLVDDGYEHVGHSWAIHHGIQTATYNLQGY